MSTGIVKGEKVTHDRHSSDNLHRVDAEEIELRVLAQLRMDAEHTTSFDREDDPDGVDTVKLRSLLSLKDAEKVLAGGVVKSVDFHKSKAAELFACKEEVVTEEMRRFAKCYHFAELYGNPHASVQARIDADLEKLRQKIG